MSTDTIPARLLARAERHPDLPAYHAHVDDAWRVTPWSAYVQEVRTAARALVALGLAPGDRVCILGFNRPEWAVFDHAAMLAGGVPAGIYTTSSPSEVRYIVDHADARIVLVEDAAQWEKIDEERTRLPKLEHVVLMRGAEVDDPTAVPWDDFLALASSVEPDEVDRRVEALRPDDPATFIYTSGTTGPPKAVVLTHENLAHTASVAVEMVGVDPRDRMVSYLPLSHIAEQMFTLHGPATAGFAIWFARSLDTILEDFQAARPTVLFAVPRVWEKMHARLADALSKATGVKAFLVGWATQVGRQVAHVRNAGGEPGGFLAFQYRLARERIQLPIKQRLGLDALRVAISGAAPIAPEVLEFFAGLDVLVHEVYGQSEGSGPTSFNVPGRTRFGTVGPAIPGTEIRIAADGEVLLRGKNVFAGYFKDPEATAETLVDGWLHSGDLGELDADGFLTITGRKKEIIITAGGKNVAPKNLEAALKGLPLVSQAVVVGDRRPYLVALLTLEPDAAESFAQERGLSMEGLHERPEVQEALQQAIDRQVNPELARVEQIKRFAVLPRDFTIEAGELTPTMKIKRRVVDEQWSEAIARLYVEG